MTIKAYYRLNGNSNDASGNGFNGIDTAIAYSQVNGRLNQGAAFNGSTSKIITASNIGLSGNAEFTMMAWIKPTSLGTYAIIDFGSYNASTPTECVLIMHLLIVGDFGVSFGAAKYYMSAGSKITAGIWQHVCATKTAGAINTTTKIYLNGNLIAANTASTATLNITNSKLTVGYSTSYGGLGFNGAIDEPLVDVRAWSQVEIKNKIASYKGFF